MNRSSGISCFLGANSPVGFVSQFERAYNLTDGWRVYIIKGGPGTGKSSFMKKAANQAEKQGLLHYVAYCSSDPLSVDAVVIPEIRIMIADGTAPHAMCPYAHSL